MRRPWLVMSGLTLLLLLSLSIAVSVGEDLGRGRVIEVLRYRLFFASGPVPDPTADRIVWLLRMPRAVLALVVGGGLAMIGAAMQTLVRNPLAEPYILGISGGASAGASLFYLGLVPPLFSKALSMPVAAFLGGLGTITIVYLVARSHTRLSVARLLLTGVAMAALMGAVTSFITFSSPEPDKLRAVLFWLLGSLHRATWSLVPVPALATALGLATLVALSRLLDAMLLGDEAAHGLGVPVEALKGVLILVAALVTGALVSASGAIGFVGLIIPHIVRSTLGVTHRGLLLGCFFAGGLFLLWADLAARAVLPLQEMPVGIVTALCGVPFFLVLLRRTTYDFG